jgi:glycolate oxidase
MSEEYGLDVANVFHAGDGNLHPLILFDANKPGDTHKAEEFGAEILELCVAVGGCITGEHGVGLEKIRQMPAQFGDHEVAQFHAVKSAFDPNNRLNPGKGIPLLRYCQEYRSLKARQVEQP